MSRKPKDEKDIKVNITIRIKASNIEKLRQIKNYNSLIDSLLENYFLENKKND